MRSNRSYYFLAVFVLPVLFLLQNPKIIAPVHGATFSLLKPVFETGRSVSVFFSYYFLAVFVLPFLFLHQNPKIAAPVRGVTFSLLKPVFETGRSVSVFFSSADTAARRFWQTFHAQEDYQGRIMKLESQLKTLEEAAKENARLRK